MTTTKDRIIGNYILGDTLGEGGFARVKLGTHKDTGKKVAMKVLPKKHLDTTSSEFKQVKREIDALSNLNHANILRMYEVDWNAQYPKADGGNQDVLLIVLELAGGGELFDFLSYTGCFDERVARTYFHQLISGLKECHSQGIAHRDLKPENLLLDNEFVLKIADFGFAHMNSNDSAKHVMRTECGTKGYMAPEVLAGKAYDESADLFSAGVILFIMLAGFPPFQFATKQDWWFNKLMTDKHSLFWKAHERSAYFSDTAKDLVNKILSPEASKRITIDQIEEHDWFKGPVLSDEELREDLGARKEKVDREKRKEKANKKPGATKLIELGDSYIVNRAIIGPDGLPVQDPLLLIEKRRGAGSEEGKEVSALNVPETYASNAGMNAYTVFETKLEALTFLVAMHDLLEAIKAGPEFDKEHSCTIKATFTPKGPLMQPPADMLEEDNALSVMNVGSSEDAVAFTIRVFQSGSKKDTRVVVIRRMEGSSITFQRFFDELLDTLREWNYVADN
jgi:serine/threonine protein kinase